MTKTIKVLLTIFIVLILSAIKLGFDAAGVIPGIVWVLLMFGALGAIRFIWRYGKQKEE